MKKAKNLFIYSVTIIPSLIFFYSTISWTQIMHNTQNKHIEVTPGESCQQLASRYPNITDTEQQYSINFCDIKTISRKKFPLTLKHGKHSITVPFVNRLKGAEQINRKVGMDKMHIMFSLNNASTIMHDDARRTLFAMFKQLLANGWQVFIFPSDPRLRGRDAMINKLPKKSKPFSLDATYEPTLAEWMDIEEMTEWRFYADQLYIDIYFHRNQEKMDPNQPGEYFLQMNVTSGETHYREEFDNKQREQWREHWVELALDMRKDREQAEAHARRIGLSIDTHYQDPPLPPPPPGMSNPALPPELTQLRHVPLGTRAYSDAVCPQTGLWQCLAPEAEAQTRMLQEGATMPKYTAAPPQQHPLWQWLTGTTPLAKYVEWKLINYG